MRQTLGFYLLTFAIFGLLAFTLKNIEDFNQHNLEESLDGNSSFTYNNHAASKEDMYANALDDSGIRLHPGTDFNTQSRSTTSSLNHCKALVYETLEQLPEAHSKYLNNLTLYFADGRRGLGGGSTIILRCSEIDDLQLRSVLVHEMGHVVDTGLYTGSFWDGKSEFMDGNIPIYNDDLSLKFYRISWNNEKTLDPETEMVDFVTKYAMTDPFEDFAETYNFYILHGEQFRTLAKTSKNLETKYLFMKFYIFSGQEFDNDSHTKVSLTDRYYDSTLLSYNEDMFINKY